MAPLNVGVIGYGFSAKSFHLPFIIPNKDLHVYSFFQRKEAPTDPKSAKTGEHCTVDFPDAVHYRKADEFFGDDKIDLVIVCSHHDTHAEYAEKAMRAGKHVVVEKPFTVNAADADHLIKVQEETGKTLTVFQNRRYDSDFLTLKQLHDKNVFGEVTECELHYDVDFPFWMRGWDSPDWSPGQGMMFGLGSHTIDQALCLFGRPSSVTGFYRSLRGVKSKTDDTFTIILQYKEKNLFVTIKTTVVNPLEQPLKYFIRGYDGSFIKYGEDVQESQHASGLTDATDPKFGVEPTSTHGLLVTKDKIHDSQTKDEASGRYIGKYPSARGDYVGFYKDLVAAVQGKGELKVKPEESRDGIRVIELARESAEKGATVPFS